jgi:hypothetical protein
MVSLSRERVMVRRYFKFAQRIISYQYHRDVHRCHLAILYKKSKEYSSEKLHIIYVKCVNNNVACVVLRRRDIPVRLAMPHATHSKKARLFQSYAIPKIVSL